MEKIIAPKQSLKLGCSKPGTRLTRIRISGYPLFRVPKIVTRISRLNRVGNRISGFDCFPKIVFFFQISLNIFLFNIQILNLQKIKILNINIRIQLQNIKHKYQNSIKITGNRSSLSSITLQTNTDILFLYNLHINIQYIIHSCRFNGKLMENLTNEENPT